MAKKNTYVETNKKEKQTKLSNKTIIIVFTSIIVGFTILGFGLGILTAFLTA